MNYRLYIMSPRTGHIERFEDFIAPDDAAAGEVAEQRAGDKPVELWQDRRKLREHPGGSGFMSEATHPRHDWSGSQAA